jgi:hypothetical protein
VDRLDDGHFRIVDRLLCGRNGTRLEDGDGAVGVETAQEGLRAGFVVREDPLLAMLEVDVDWAALWVVAHGVWVKQTDEGRLYSYECCECICVE